MMSGSAHGALSTYGRIFTAAQDAGLLTTDEQAMIAGVAQFLSVDSTVVRAHQHAAGVRRDSVSSPAGEATPGHVGPIE